MTAKKKDLEGQDQELDQEPDQEPDQEERPAPPDYISEANRILIQQTGQAFETFTGRVLTTEDLNAYNNAQLEKGS